MTIRQLITRDLPAISAIAAASYTNPLTAVQYEKLAMRRKWMGVVATDNHAVIGFLFFQEKMGRLIELYDLAVAPAYRRRHVGTELVHKITGQLHRLEADEIQASVPEDNVGAQMFLKRLGFEAFTILGANDGPRYRFRYPACGIATEAFLANVRSCNNYKGVLR